MLRSMVLFNAVGTIKNQFHKAWADLKLAHNTVHLSEFERLMWIECCASLTRKADSFHRSTHARRMSGEYSQL